MINNNNPESFLVNKSTYCFCKESDGDSFMIQCDGCFEWFHGRCVDIDEDLSRRIEKFYCKSCEIHYGNIIFKKHNDSILKSGTTEFIAMLKGRTFRDHRHIFRYINGKDLNMAHFRQHGFRNPIFVEHKQRLGLKLPDSSFNIKELLKHMDPTKLIDVIDVHNQLEIKMPLKEWIKYFNKPFRDRIYNVISLELSDTELGKRILMPRIVRKMSWVELYWPKPPKNLNLTTYPSPKHISPKSSPEKKPINSSNTITVGNTTRLNNSFSSPHNKESPKISPTKVLPSTPTKNGNHGNVPVSPLGMNNRRRSNEFLEYNIFFETKKTESINTNSQSTENGPFLSLPKLKIKLKHTHNNGNTKDQQTSPQSSNNSNQSSPIKSPTSSLECSRLQKLPSSPNTSKNGTIANPKTTLIDQIDTKNNVNIKPPMALGGNVSHTCDKSLTPSRFITDTLNSNFPRPENTETSTLFASTSPRYFVPTGQTKSFGCQRALNKSTTFESFSAIHKETLKTEIHNHPYDDNVNVLIRPIKQMQKDDFNTSYNSNNNCTIKNSDIIKKEETKSSKLLSSPLNLNAKIERSQRSGSGYYYWLEKPCVEKYILMSVRDSYTDFHIDFGGSSVWYHVLRGEKIFYLIPPTQKNLDQYEKWSKLPDQTEVFFADMVDPQDVYQCKIVQGQTIFLPSGWIHAVLTPIDSVVFGGNFLHSYSVPLQIKVYELETRLKTAYRFMFPYFDYLCWIAADNLTRKLNEFADEESPCPPVYLCKASQNLLEQLKIWEKIPEHMMGVPEFVDTGIILKHLEKTLQNIKIAHDIDTLISQHDKSNPTSENYVLYENLDLERPLTDYLPIQKEEESLAKKIRIS